MDAVAAEVSAAPVDGGGSLEDIANALLAEDSGDAPPEDAAPAPELEAKPKLEEPKPEEPKKPDVDAEFTALAKKERRLKSRQEEFGKEKSEFQKEREAFQKERETYAESLKKGRSDPETLLKEAGWSLDQFADWLLKGRKVPPEKMIADLRAEQQREIESLRAEREAERARIQQEREAEEKEELARQSQTYSQRVRARTQELLAGGEYPWCAAEEDDVPAVVERLIKQNFKEKGVALAPEDVLGYYEDRFRRIAERRGIKSDASQGGPVKPGKPEAAKPVPKEPTPISNRESSERSYREAPEDDEDEDTRFKRALALL